jgi:hypothetical protein
MNLSFDPSLLTGDTVHVDEHGGKVGVTDGAFGTATVVRGAGLARGGRYIGITHGPAHF